MQKNIPFSYGIHRSPSIGNDGELSECVNLMPKNGEIVNIHPPQDIGITLQEGEKLLYVHNVSGENNYIVLLPNAEIGGTLAYYNEKSERHIIEDESMYWNSTVNSVCSVGNTLIVLFDSGIRYYLFKSGTYKSLGSHVPDLEIVFGLQARKDSEGTNQNVYITESTENRIFSVGTYKVNGTGNNEMLNQVFSLLNPVLDKERENGRFFNPFLVRYAYRTHGGAYLYVSNPVLMVPNSGAFPYIEAVGGLEFKLSGYDNFTSKSEMFNLFLVQGPTLVGAQNIYFRFNSCELCYKILDLNAFSMIEDWSDIIQSIDIFVTNPSISRLKNEGSCNIYIHGAQYGPNYKPSGGYMNTDSGVFCYSGDYDFSNADLITLPQMDNKEYEDAIANEGVFRLAESITIEDLKNRYNKYDGGFIPADVGSLNNINSREQLDTSYDYHSRDNIVPSYAFPYNSRLNISGIKRYPYCPSANMMFTYTNGYKNEEGNAVQKVYNVTVYAYLAESGKKVKVIGRRTQLYDMPSWVFFPSSKATMLIFERYDLETQEYTYASLPLKQHKTLDGSYYMKREESEVLSFNPFEKEQIEFTSERPAILNEEYDDFVLEPNKIYTSEVDNPFVFPLSGINTIGTGDIISICSTTKALSQGQFGQFPLYVFSSDGIWAMEVDADTGLYSSIHPVSRDVCSNSKSIVQIDNAIVFASEQGLKLLQGSDVALISRAMDGYNMDKSIYNILAEYSDLFVEDNKTFVDVLRDCSIVYDYPNALLHIYPSEGTKHYIYSFESGEYASFVGHQLESSVPGYPESVLQIGDKLFSYKNKMSDVIQKGYLITRPLSFDDPLAMKIIEDLRIISRRSSGESKVRYAVFASNDNRVWCQLYSLRSRSYKYFRFVVFTDMYDVDTISGMSVQFSYKRTGKMR